MQVQPMTQAPSGSRARTPGACLHRGLPHCHVSGSPGNGPVVWSKEVMKKQSAREAQEGCDVLPCRAKATRDRLICSPELEPRRNVPSI
jgi:hypothetical protein